MKSTAFYQPVKNVAGVDLTLRLAASALALIVDLLHLGRDVVFDVTLGYRLAHLEVAEDAREAHPATYPAGAQLQGKA